MMKNFAAADGCDISGTAGLYESGLAAWLGRPDVAGTDRDTAAFELRHGPLGDGFIRGLQPQRLSRRAEIRTEVQPAVTALEQIAATREVTPHTKESELMARDCDKQAPSFRRRLDGRAQCFQPARDAAAALTRTLPPAAARRGDDDRREIGVRARDFHRHVICARWLSRDLRHHDCLNAARSTLSQPFAFAVRDLDDRRT